MRQRPAPSVARIAISRRRPVARTRSKFATFAHAIKRTKPTAPKSTSNIGRALRTTASRIDNALNPLFALKLGKRSRYCAAEASRRACACSSVTPGLSRAAVWK